MDTNTQIYETKNSSDRLVYIDCIKGFGILCVIVGHHLLESEKITMWIYSFHMPLFFIMTGMLSVNSQNKTNFLSRKIRSLIYPYVTFSAINLAWYTLFHVLLGFYSDESFLTVIIKTLTTYGYHALWFLPTMFLASSISFYGRSIGLFRPIGLTLLIITGSMAACLIIRYCPSGSLLRYIATYLTRVILAVSFIGIGTYLFHFFSYIGDRIEWLLLIGALVCSLLSFENFAGVNMAVARIGNPLFFYIAACSGSVFVILLCKKTIVGRNRFLKFMGQNSLIVMALHMDIPIQIAWILIGIMKLSHVVSLFWSSIVAIIIELGLVIIAVILINRYAPFLLFPPSKRIKSTKTK